MKNMVNLLSRSIRIKIYFFSLVVLFLSVNSVYASGYLPRFAVSPADAYHGDCLSNSSVCVDKRTGVVNAKIPLATLGIGSPFELSMRFSNHAYHTGRPNFIAQGWVFAIPEMHYHILEKNSNYGQADYAYGAYIRRNGQTYYLYKPALIKSSGNYKAYNIKPVFNDFPSGMTITLLTFKTDDVIYVDKPDGTREEFTRAQPDEPWLLKRIVKEPGFSVRFSYGGDDFNELKTVFVKIGDEQQTIDIHYDEEIDYVSKITSTITGETKNVVTFQRSSEYPETLESITRGNGAITSFKVSATGRNEPAWLDSITYPSGHSYEFTYNTPINDHECSPNKWCSQYNYMGLGGHSEYLHTKIKNLAEMHILDGQYTTMLHFVYSSQDPKSPFYHHDYTGYGSEDIYALGGGQTGALSYYMPNPNTPSNQYLYRVQVSITHSGSSISTVRSFYFGSLQRLIDKKTVRYDGSQEISSTDVGNLFNPNGGSGHLISGNNLPLLPMSTVGVDNAVAVDSMMNMALTGRHWDSLPKYIDNKPSFSLSEYSIFNSAGKRSNYNRYAFASYHMDSGYLARLITGVGNQYGCGTGNHCWLNNHYSNHTMTIKYQEESYDTFLNNYNYFLPSSIETTTPKDGTYKTVNTIAYYNQASYLSGRPVSYYQISKRETYYKPGADAGSDGISTKSGTLITTGAETGYYPLIQIGYHWGNSKGQYPFVYQTDTTYPAGSPLFSSKGIMLNTGTINSTFLTNPSSVTNYNYTLKIDKDNPNQSTINVSSTVPVQLKSGVANTYVTNSGTYAMASGLPLLIAAPPLKGVQAVTGFAYDSIGRITAEMTSDMNLAAGSSHVTSQLHYQYSPANSQNPYISTIYAGKTYNPQDADEYYTTLDYFNDRGRVASTWDNAYSYLNRKGQVVVPTCSSTNNGLCQLTQSNYNTLGQNDSTIYYNMRNQPDVETNPEILYHYNNQGLLIQSGTQDGVQTYWAYAPIADIDHNIMSVEAQFSKPKGTEHLSPTPPISITAVNLFTGNVDYYAAYYPSSNTDNGEPAQAVDVYNDCSKDGKIDINGSCLASIIKNKDYYNKASVTLNQWGNVIKQTGISPDQQQYDSNKLVSSTYLYNPLGQVIETTAPNGSHAYTRYNTNGSAVCSALSAKGVDYNSCDTDNPTRPTDNTVQLLGAQEVNRLGEVIAHMSGAGDIAYASYHQDGAIADTKDYLGQKTLYHYSSIYTRLRDITYQNVNTTAQGHTINSTAFPIYFAHSAAYPLRVIMVRQKDSVGPKVLYPSELEYWYAFGGAIRRKATLEWPGVKQWQHERVYNYSYSAAGQLLKLETGALTNPHYIQYTYGEHGLHSIDFGNAITNATKVYGYDGYGRLNEVKNPKTGSPNLMDHSQWDTYYAYNYANQLYQVKDMFDNRGTLQSPSLIQKVYYNAGGKTRSVKLSIPLENESSHVHYWYDSLGRIKHYFYGKRSNNALIPETASDEPIRSRDYTYTLSGAIASVKTNGNIKTLTYYSGHPNRLKTMSTLSGNFTYDADGNTITTPTGNKYYYNNLNHMIYSKNPQYGALGGDVTYSYLPNGAVGHTIVSYVSDPENIEYGLSTYNYYSNGQLIQQSQRKYNSQQDLSQKKRFYVPGIASVLQGAGEHDGIDYIHKDIMGNVMAISDKNTANFTDPIVYTPFGSETKNAPAHKTFNLTHNHFGYQGLQSFPGTGLVGINSGTPYNPQTMSYIKPVGSGADPYI